MMQKIILFAFLLTFCPNALSDDKQNSQQLEEIVKAFKSLEKRFETLEKENLNLKDKIKTIENKDVEQRLAHVEEISKLKLFLFY